jgi:hypothetical protein
VVIVTSGHGLGFYDDWRRLEAPAAGQERVVAPLCASVFQSQCCFLKVITITTGC